jgi:DnaJ-domain-containing protein 1
MQQAIILDDIKGSELLNILKDSGLFLKISRLIPEKNYTISIQPTEDKEALLQDMQNFLNEQEPDPAIAGKSEEEIMEMADKFIAECRSEHRQHTNK